MGEKLVIGPINKGLKTDRLPFFIDNDSFPNLINGYQWRGRVKRKRGTTFLTHLNRFFNSTNTTYNSGNSTITLNGSGAGNLLTGFTSLESTANLVPSSITITGFFFTYTDDGKGNLSNGIINLGTVNYATGAIVIAGEAGRTETASFAYYPNLPVMGLEQLQIPNLPFPGNLGFDTTYSYNIVPQAPPAPSYSVSFYKNPLTGTYPSYVAKTAWTQALWFGLNYQQIWTLNYENSLFATNGIQIPFLSTNIGMQYKLINGIAITNPTTVVISILTSGLVVGDFLFINEVNGINGINYQTGYVTAITPQISPLNDLVTVVFPFATISGAYTNGGIAQYLTSSAAVPGINCIRWYDGDPTNGSATNPVLNTPNGWVNFMPPLSTAPFSISGLPPAVYYLVGARMIVSFKDRLVFIGPVVQASTGVPIYLQDTLLYSQNGTPYYTCSFPVGILPWEPSTGNTFVPILVPLNQTATPFSFFENLTGFGGNIPLGINQRINTSSTNEDVLILGCDTKQIRMTYTGSDILPFNFFIVNAELGSSSTFSTVNMDQAVMTRGSRGYILANQTEVQRFDLEDPDTVFAVSLTNNGTERFTAIRDFQLEWVYFSYPASSSSLIFNNQTFFYNYRDQSFAIFNESFTTYGVFQSNTSVTWASWILPWSQYDDPWSSGIGEAGDPLVIGGNTQGFVLIKDTGTGEGTSLYIQSISTSTITSPNHCLSNGDFIYISGVQGTVSQFINNRIFQVINVNTTQFNLNPPLPIISPPATYTGGGLITRAYIPQIQSKQFPVAWNMARKTRLGPQQYLFTTTLVSQITLQIFLSQNAEFPYNSPPIVPADDVTNNTLIYSQVLYTCPESANLGLTPANTNLQMVTGAQQQQIWHRINTSLLGDTIQFGFTLSPQQMTMLYPIQAGTQITGATNAFPCVLACAVTYQIGTILQITGVLGMTQLNYNPFVNNVWVVTASNGTLVTIDCDATTFGTFITPTPPQVYGIATPVNYQNHIAEIEFHSAILDISPSQMLA